MSTKAIIMIITFGVLAGIFFRSISMKPDPQISLKNARLEATFSRPGQPARKGSLSANSSGAAAINSLLDKHRGRWKRSWITYAPAVVVNSDDFILNIHRNLLILNYRKKNSSDTFTQVVSELTEKEFDHTSKSILESLVESPPEASQ
ncbi:hypothetical protein [Singulisphaera acidiphila]|uniref:hypothetical protein n=1 Tax=Singulisphaera acidiphila TaxID=466153 RepID=UPI000376E929|nr:hypothetical protein [Singulisphaera acidiphila]